MSGYFCVCDMCINERRELHVNVCRRYVWWMVRVCHTAPWWSMLRATSSTSTSSFVFSTSCQCTRWTHFICIWPTTKDGASKFQHCPSSPTSVCYTLRLNLLIYFFTLHIFHIFRCGPRNGWLGGVACRTRDREVSGSTPGRCTVRQQLWESCQHPCASVTKHYNLVPAKGRWCSATG